VPFAVWLLAAFAYVRPGLGEMTVPVVVYMLAIGTMMWRAARSGDHLGGTVALIGAVLLGLSDTLIAIDRSTRRFQARRRSRSSFSIGRPGGSLRPRWPRPIPAR
jgi:uncharacterized membrane protein YhhN